jgi:hypothetical protein
MEKLRGIHCRKGMSLKAIFAAAIIAAGVAITPAGAGERLSDGAMGTVAGAPVGSVAGGVIGYTAGPDIARGVSPRHRRLHDDRYDDRTGDGHRNAWR